MSIHLSEEWANAPKEKNPDFEGSMWQEMGYDNALCPTCKTHLRKGICLNACHLSAASRARFHKLWSDMAGPS